jgi:hypothetical protein
MSAMAMRDFGNVAHPDFSVPNNLLLVLRRAGLEDGQMTLANDNGELMHGTVRKCHVD